MFLVTLVGVIVIISLCLFQIMFLYTQDVSYSNGNDLLALSLAYFTKSYKTDKTRFSSQPQLRRVPVLVAVPPTPPIQTNNVTTPKLPILSRQCEAIINTSPFHEFCINYTTSSKSKGKTKQTHSKCQQHERLPYQVEKDIIWNHTVVDIPKCKTLWIVAMSEGDRSSCQNTGDGEGDGYKTAYATALQSARQHAGESLQPVLFIGRGDIDPSMISEKGHEAPIPLSPFGQWAEQQGVIVRQVHQLSFQALVDKGLPHYSREKRVGFFLLFDIPQILQQHGLLNHNPEICDSHIFYTDADVLFVNDFTREDLHAVKHRMMQSNKILSYGRDFVIWRKRPVNTGVIVMDVQGFAREWPKILDFASRQKVFPDHDQTLLYEYYADRKFHLSQVDVLPLYMHWKVYWRLDPSTMNDIKIVHFHGAKPGSGVEEMAQCSAVTHDDMISDNIPSTYRVFLQEAICCDHGRTAATILELYHAWRPVGISAICDSR